MEKNEQVEQRTSTLSRFKIALALMILGFAIAVVLAVVPQYCLNPEGQTYREVIKMFDRFWLWVWPTAIMVSVDSDDPFVGTVILLISAIANACLYGIVGLAIGTVWQELHTRKGKPMNGDANGR